MSIFNFFMDLLDFCSLPEKVTIKVKVEVLLKAFFHYLNKTFLSRSDLANTHLKKKELAANLHKIVKSEIDNW